MHQPITSLTSFKAPGRWTTRGEFGSYSFEDLRGMLERPVLWPSTETVDRSRDQLPAFSFCRYEEHTRDGSADPEAEARLTAARVEQVYGIAVEYIDDPTVNAERIARWWGRFCHVAYTTSHHLRPLGGRPQGPRWRVLLPFSRPVDLDEARVVASWARHPRQNAGIVADVTDEVWRYWFAPSIVPGLPRWTAEGDAPPLDPSLALAEIRRWSAGLVQEEAFEELQGTSIGEIAQRYARHMQVDSMYGRIFLPEAWEPLEDLVGASWAGRLIWLRGEPGTGRTSFGLQWAEAAARAGHPALVASTLGTDELVSRLLAQRARRGGESVSHRSVLDGRWSGTALAERLRALDQSAKRLHLWAPARESRTTESVLQRCRAMARAYASHVPLIVIDSASAFVEHPAALRDLARPGGLAADWPGAVVLAVAGPDDALDGAEVDLDLCLRRYGDSELQLEVRRNQHGERGAIPFEFDGAAGWLSA